MTFNQISRVYQAIEETERIIAKEMTYKIHRNDALIAQCQKHIQKLQNMLHEEVSK